MKVILWSAFTCEASAILLSCVTVFGVSTPGTSLYSLAKIRFYEVLKFKVVSGLPGHLLQYVALAQESFTLFVLRF